MKKAAVLAILAMFVAGCAGRDDFGRTSTQDDPRTAPGWADPARDRPADPNFPTGVPGTGVPGSAPGGIR
jgi:hypothetical protein